MLIQGDARQLPLQAQSVHCVVTSPPYWGLRDYKVGASIWGRWDGACQHEWGREERGRRGDMLPSSESSSNGRVGSDDRQGIGPPPGGNYCIRCNAWRGSLGLEPTPNLYVAHMVEVFREVKRVLRDDGTLWLNLGDSYAAKPAGANGYHDGRSNREERSSGGVPQGLKPKDLVGIPWRVAFALQADGWYLRSDIIWSKPNPMPESVMDRPTKAHEYLFLLAKSERYYYDAAAIQERGTGIPWNSAHSTFANPGDKKKMAIADGLRTWGGDTFHPDIDQIGRNRRSVWTIATQPYPEAHFATFPEELVSPCVLAGCPPGGRVLDPFAGSGTVGEVCSRLGRKAVLVELAPHYIRLARARTAQMGLV